MHPLLEPADGTVDARRRCERWLARNLRPWSVARLTLSPSERNGVAPLLGWVALLQTASAREDFERRRWVEELEATLERVLGRSDPSVLGSLLGATVARHELSGTLLRSPLDALRDELHRHAFPSRSELIAHLRQRTFGPAQALLRVLALTGEREEIEARALATGLQLCEWTASLERDIARGRWFVAVEDVLRHGIALDEAPADDHRWRALQAEYVAWARRELSKGWSLCAALGPIRGRALAFHLRFVAAGLSGREAAEFRTGRRPSAGWLRFGACLAASATTSAMPRWE